MKRFITILLAILVTSSSAGELGSGSMIAPCCPLDYSGHSGLGPNTTIATCCILDYSEHGVELLSDGFED